jgi:hypothetical protein
MLEWGEGDNWAAEVALPFGEHAFKLVIMRSDGSQYWEEGENRQLAVVATAPSAAPALRVVALFGKTADTAVAQPPIEAEVRRPAKRTKLGQVQGLWISNRVDDFLCTSPPLHSAMCSPDANPCDHCRATPL